MTGGPSKNFHGVGIGPLSKILAVKWIILILWAPKAVLAVKEYLQKFSLKKRNFFDVIHKLIESI